MKSRLKLIMPALLGIALLTACGEDHQGIKAGKAWALALPAVSHNGAAYVSLVNHGEDDRLLSVDSDVADRVELHQHVMQGGQMSMTKVDYIKIPAGSSLVLGPGGYHIMLKNLKQPLESGKEFKLKLVFDHSPTRTVTAKIVDTPPEHAQHGQEH